MPTQNQKSCIESAVLAIRNAQNLISQQIDASSDMQVSVKLQNQYSSLDSCLSQLLHAQNVADDAIFSSAISALRSQTAGLQKDDLAVKKIIADVATANKVLGYISQAIGFIAKL